MTNWLDIVNTYLKRYQIKERLGARAVPIQLPIGAEEKFEGIVDLVRMKAIYWEVENLGVAYEEREIPDGLKEKAENWRQNFRAAFPDHPLSRSDT